MIIETKIKNKCRKWLLTIPSIVMKGLNWGEEVVHMEIDPEENSIKIINFSNKPVGNFQFLENINQAKYEKNAKEYRKALSAGLSKNGREVLYDTNWDEVEDGGYSNVQNNWNFAKSLKKMSERNKDTELKKIEESLSKTYKLYAIGIKKMLEKKGLKKPVWFKELE